jgi:hypothetical protein
MENRLSLDEKNYIIGYLLEEGFAADEKSAAKIMYHMGENWLYNVLDEEYRDISRKAGAMARRAARLGVTAGGAHVGARALRTGGLRNAIRKHLGLKPKVRNHSGADELEARSGSDKKKAATIVAVLDTHSPELAQAKEHGNRTRGELARGAQTAASRERLERSYAKS